MKFAILFLFLTIFQKPIQSSHDLFKNRQWCCVKQTVHGTTTSVSRTDCRYNFFLDFRNSGGQTGNHFSRWNKDQTFDYSSSWSYSHNTLKLDGNSEHPDETFVVETLRDDNFVILTTQPGDRYYLISVE